MSQLGLSLAKKYIKYPHFLSLGFNLLTGASMSAVATAPAIFFNAPGPIIASTIIFPFFLHSIISAMSSIDGDEGISGKLFFPLKKLSQMIVNNYTNIDAHHLLDEKNGQNDIDKSAIKHFFLNAYIYKHDYGSISQESYKKTIEKTSKLDKNSFYSSVYYEALKNPNAKSFIEDTFSFFKNDALFTSSFKKQNYSYEFHQSQRLDLLAQINTITPIITHKDVKALRSIFKNKTIDDQFSGILIKKQYYQCFPKDFRDELIKHMSSNFLNEHKKDILSLEASLENNLIQDIENHNNKNKLEKIQNNIEKHEALIHAKALEGTSQKLPLKIKKVLDNTLENAEYLSENLSFLSATESIEFKNLINTILPKYLELFITQDIKKEEQIDKIVQNLTMINECFEAFKEEIHNQKSNSLEAYENFVENKIQVLHVNSSKLKSTM
jgi:hypothetical protein